MPSTRFTQLTVSQKLTKIFILGKKQLIVHTSDYNQYYGHIKLQFFKKYEQIFCGFSD